MGPGRTPRAGRDALWAAAATMALLAVGFGGRGQASSSERDEADTVRRLDPSRGRLAAHPADIPRKGWLDIGARLYANISEHRVLGIAAGVTFYSILAIFPALAALVSLYGLFADPGSIAGHLDRVNGLMPGGAVEVMREQMSRVAGQGHGKLGLTFGISLAVALWSANSGVKALFDALNVVYAEREKRGFFRLNGLSLAFTTAAILFMLLAMAAVVILPPALSAVGLAGLTEWAVRLLRWPVLFLALTFALAAVYRYGPSRNRPQWRWITWGSAFAAMVWLAGSILFSWYAANFGHYNATYGSLGGIIGFMMWIWLSASVVLIGAELDAEMEHQTVRDTTVGRPKPLGMRGARMADTVGRARGAA